jgi:hypothetical protein
MPRRRTWVLIAAALLVVAAAVIVALPLAVRWAAVRQLGAATGRDVAIADVDFNLFTRRLAIADLAVASRDGGPPFLAVPRVDATFRLLPLFLGRLHLTRLIVHNPEVRVVRTRDGGLDVRDVVQTFTSRPAGARLTFIIEEGLLEGGHAVLEDRALAPVRRWEASGVNLTLHDISTLAAEPRGTATARLMLAGAPVAIDAETVGVRPVRARGTVSIAGLDLAPLALYVPADAPVRPSAGRFTTRVRFDYGRDGLRASSDSTFSDVVLARLGQDQPFVTTPTLAVVSREVRYVNGVLRAGRIEVSGAPSVLDASVDPAQRFDVQSLHLVAEDLRLPGSEPGRVALDLALRDAGTLTARGTLAVLPVSTALAVDIAGVDLARLVPYLPATAPVRLVGGHAGATLDARYATRAGVRLSGDVRLTELVVNRAGQSQPFITHRRLDASMADLVVRGRALALGQLTLQGAPVIVDASVSPPQRFEVAAFGVTVRDLAWPAGSAARIEGHARLAAGASARLQGTIEPATLKTRARVRVAGFDVRRFAAYVPDGTGVRPAGGRIGADLAVRYARGEAVTIDGTATVEDAAAARPGETEPFLTASRLDLSLGGVAIKDGAVQARRLAVAGAPTLVDTRGREPNRFAVRGLSLAAEHLTWPAGQPAAVALTADLPEAGRLEATGTLALATRRVDLAVTLVDAALAPYATLTGIDAPLDGRLDASLDVSGAFARSLELQLTGRATARALRLGEEEHPVASVERIDVTGLRVRWPDEVTVARAVVSRPSALVERREDGSFPIRAMLSGGREEEAAASPGVEEARADEPQTAPRVTIDEMVVSDGEVRFVDHTTRPFYSEEMTKLSLDVRELTTMPEERVRMSLQAIVGGSAALDLDGVLAPFSTPFFLDVSGELRDFSVARTNPYLRRFLDWIARRGELTTKVHYRVEGRQLSATNEIVVERLDVAPAGQEPDKLVGVPLGLVVALLKNSHGDIRLTVPVSGDVGSPSFSFGEALRTALRNVLTKLVTGPFQAIGRVFRRDGKVDDLQVNPVVFDPGSAVISAEAARQVQRVADVLRASPYVRLALAPVVTDQDLATLRAQAVAARIQRLQREAGLASFEAAATTLFRTRFPDRTPPETAEETIAALRGSEPVADDAAQRLAERRLRSTQQAFIESAGIDAGRLQRAAGAANPGGPGSPRVEFHLLPAG